MSDKNIPVYTRDFSRRLPKRRQGQYTPAELAIKRAAVAAKLHAAKTPKERREHALKMAAARWPKLTAEEVLCRQAAAHARALRQLASQIRGPEGVPTKCPRTLAAELRELAAKVEGLGS